MSQNKPNWCTRCDKHCYNFQDNVKYLWCNELNKAVIGMQMCPLAYWKKVDQPLKGFKQFSFFVSDYLEN